MGGNGNIDLSQIPLMTKAQEGALAELLPAVMGMMGGFELGTPYQPGAYSPTSFPEFTGEHIVKKDGDGGGGGDGDKITKDQLTKPNGGLTKEQLTAPEGWTGGDGGDGKTVIRDGTVQPRTNGSVLDSILSPPPGPIGTPGTTGGQVAPGGKGGAPTTTNIPNVQIPETQPISPVQQTLTEPIISPFREGMTGNYPRRRI